MYHLIIPSFPYLAKWGNTLDMKIDAKLRLYISKAFQVGISQKL